MAAHRRRTHPPLADEAGHGRTSAPPRHGGSSSAEEAQPYLSLDTRGQCLGPAAPGTSHRAAPCSETGLVPGSDRRLAPPGPSGRPKTGPGTVDRARPGSKHHVITDVGGTPLAITLTGGNRHDITHLLPLLDATPASAAGPADHVTGPGSCSPTALEARHQTGHRPQGKYLTDPAGYSPMGRRTHKHLIHGLRRLRIRWDIRDDLHEAFLKAPCCVITYRRTQALD
ncbi:transposase [Streptomyces clavuligerus]|uniref:transposase n=1 Tax=Streptomyces clavuligerus TaxID=1901 RepID=UPI0034D5A8A9